MMIIIRASYNYMRKKCTNGEENITTYGERNNASHLHFKRYKERRKSLPGFHRTESCEAIAQNM